MLSTDVYIEVVEAKSNKSSSGLTIGSTTNTIILLIVNIYIPICLNFRSLILDLEEL